MLLSVILIVVVFCHHWQWIGCTDKQGSFGKLASPPLHLNCPPFFALLFPTCPLSFTAGILPSLGETPPLKHQHCQAAVLLLGCHHGRRRWNSSDNWRCDHNAMTAADSPIHPCHGHVILLLMGEMMISGERGGWCWQWAWCVCVLCVERPQKIRSDLKKGNVSWSRCAFHYIEKIPSCLVYAVSVNSHVNLSRRKYSYVPTNVPTYLHIYVRTTWGWKNFDNYKQLVEVL